MNKLYILMSVSFGLLFMQNGWGQNVILSAKITYEKKENMHKQFTEMNSWTEQMIKNTPKYRIDTYELGFDTKNSYYKLMAEDESTAMSWSRIAPNNQVWVDQPSNKMTAKRQVYDKTYLIIDSLPNYEWKYPSEFRQIAGYNCRKAATIIFDSLYIIAFYTEQIPVSLGPESFNGLPGMILGIAIPRMHITWFATKVEPQLLPATVFNIPTIKAKPVNLSTLNAELSKSLKDWGEYGQKVIWKANF